MYITISHSEGKPASHIERIQLRIKFCIETCWETEPKFIQSLNQPISFFSYLLKFSIFHLIRNRKIYGLSIIFYRYEYTAMNGRVGKGFQLTLLAMVVASKLKCIGAGSLTMLIAMFTFISFAKQSIIVMIAISL